ncbi:hypothetical protein [Streptomyces sp. CC210A]|uniref:hypothetical protein n=1 Tax=Streptomyces sp. CC210A TaxID=2898184 RepID=UPI001F16178F|nr:hypothetical protein [Streptomyces sp. CC210A]
MPDSPDRVWIKRLLKRGRRTGSDSNKTETATGVVGNSPATPGNELQPPSEMRAAGLPALVIVPGSDIAVSLAVSLAAAALWLLAARFTSRNGTRT